MDLMNMMNQFGDLQKKMEESTKKLDTILVDGEAEGIKITVNGNGKVQNVSVPENLLTVDGKEELEDLLMVAFNRAFDQAEMVKAAEMQGSMFPGGMPNFPGM